MKLRTVARSSTLARTCVHVLQRCYNSVTAVLQWCYKGVTKVLRWCYSGVTLVLQWCDSGVTVVLPISCLFLGGDAHVTQRLWPVYSGVTAALRLCYSGVTVFVQWCYSGVAVILQQCYNVVTVPRDYSRHAPYTPPCSTSVPPPASLAVESVMRCYSGVTIVSQLRYSVSVLLQWCYGDLTVVLRMVQSGVTCGNAASKAMRAACVCVCVCVFACVCVCVCV
jgi:hypothetical protein